MPSKKRKLMIKFGADVFGSKEGRTEWIKNVDDNNLDLITELPRVSQLFILLLHHSRVAKNLGCISKFFKLVTSHMSSHISLLIELGFVEKKSVGRLREYSITRLGDNYCIKLIDRFMRCK